MVHVSFDPVWGEYEDKILSQDPQEAMKAAEAFDETRKKEMAVSRKARDWEEGRKAQIAKDKPHWKKEQLEKEHISEQEINRRVKDGGSVKSNIKPARGYLLIKIIDDRETKTETGILLPDAELLNNKAEILAVGEALILAKNIIPPPVEVGDRVLIKKYAGMDIEVKGDPLKLCQFTDVLGILED